MLFHESQRPYYRIIFFESGLVNFVKGISGPNPEQVDYEIQLFILIQTRVDDDSVWLWKF